MNRFNLDERQLRTNITIPVGDDLVEFNAYEYALSVVETIQRVQFALYYSHNKTHSYDLGHNSLREIEDFIKVAELAGLYIEAWLKCATPSSPSLSITVVKSTSTPQAFS